MSEEVVQSAFPAGLVFKKIAGFKPFIDLQSRAARGEFWATFVCVYLPAWGAVFLTNLIIRLIFGLGNPVSLFLTSMTNAALALVTFPVFVRRMHDLGMTGWIAAGVTMASCVTTAILGFLAWLIWPAAFAAFIVFGCLPSKPADAAVPTEKVPVLGWVTVGVVAGIGLLDAIIWCCE